MTKILTHIAILSATAFNNSGWKLDADGKLELKDGNPIYVDASGRESVVESNTITRLNGEAKTHREAKEAAEAKLKTFEGLDPEAARKAIDTVKNIDTKKLIDAGEVDKVRESIKAEFNAIIAEKDKAIESGRSELNNMKISNAFTGSEFLRERVALPLDMVQAYFGNNFKVGEDGKVTAYHRDGNPVTSKQSGNVGNPASPDEALQILIDSHPHKDMILKADGGNGSGSNGNGGNRGGGRTMKRADFEKLGPAAQAEAAGKMRSGELQITDN